MKFNEKLIELRKKEGLSQEELGYKLNVTRQTISKWELGQTTPEMEKLSEISNIFGISVDKLINETEEIKNEKTEEPIIEDKPIIENSNPKNSKIGIILIIAIVVLLVCGIFSMFNKSKSEENMKQSLLDKVFSIFDYVMDTQKDINGNAQNIIGNVQDIINDGTLEEDAQNIIGGVQDLIDDTTTGDNVQNIIENVQGVISGVTSEMGKTTFNATFNGYNGTKNGNQVKNLLDDVITSNKTNNRKVTVKYLETKTQETEEIKNVKSKINESQNFEISFEYDGEGYIYEVIIERVYTQFEIKSFNNQFEIFAGTKMGGTVTSVLDSVVTSNKTKDKKITVKYNQTETQNEDEIKNIKRNIETFDNYELTFEYDENGFINKAIIEKL